MQVLIFFLVLQLGRAQTTPQSSYFRETFGKWLSANSCAWRIRGIDEQPEEHPPLPIDCDEHGNLCFSSVLEKRIDEAAVQGTVPVDIYQPLNTPMGSVEEEEEESSAPKSMMLQEAATAVPDFGATNSLVWEISGTDEQELISTDVSQLLDIAIRCAEECELDAVNSGAPNYAKEEIRNFDKQKNDEAAAARNFICSLCSKSFKIAETLRIHWIQLHDNASSKYECEMCFKKFARRGDLKLHMRWHTKEKPFSCFLCNKNFSSFFNQKRHMIIHTGEKPFQCNVCHKQFNQMSNYRQHYSTMHNFTKPFVCRWCNKTFSIKHHLAEHLNIHEQYKPHICQQCNRAFRQVGHLKRHLLIHANEKPFQCDICHKRYNDKYNCRVHRRIHFKEKL